VDEGLLGLGLGALVRNAAGGIAALFGLLYGLPLAVNSLPGTIAADVTKFLPADAGQAVTSVHPDPTMLQPWTGFGMLCLYAVVLLGLSAARMRRGDAKSAIQLPGLRAPVSHGCPKARLDAEAGARVTPLSAGGGPIRVNRPPRCTSSTAGSCQPAPLPGQASCGDGRQAHICARAW